MNSLFQTLSSQLEEKIRSGELPPGARLPSLRRLAKMQNASVPTVIKSLRELEQKGLIVRFRGKGVYVKGKAEDAKAPESGEHETKTKAHQVAEEIAKNITQGSLRLGSPLPPSKALQYQYRVARATVARAVQVLKERGLVCANGPWYRIGSTPDSSVLWKGRHCIVLAARRQLNTQFRLGNPGGLFTAFEKEIRRTVRLKYQNVLTTLEHRNSLKSPDVVGVFHLYSLFHLKGLKTPAWERSEILTRLFQVVGASNRPFVFHWKQTLERDFPEHATKFPKNFWLFDIKNEDAGEGVGAYLAGLGHRRVAFFSFYDHEWCHARHAGLVRGMKKALGDNFEVERYGVGVKSVHHGPLRAIERWGILQKTIPQVFGGGQFINRDEAIRLTSFISLMKGRSVCAKGMQPLFKKALEDSRATVWVCADSDVAVPAMGFLERRGVKVPDGLGVVAIDDNTAMASREITAYDFQKEQMGYLAAHCILGDIPVRRNRKRVVECPGRIVERGSVRRY